MNKPMAGRTRFMTHIRANLDWQAFEQIVSRVPEQRRNKLKYLDAEKWFVRMWKHAADLRLDRAPPQSVLDFGTGPGYFPYVCRYLGHHAEALDRPGTDLYDELCRWVGVAVVPFAIAARTTLPKFDRRFDLVTAFRVGFNNKGDRQLFDLADWGFFLDDVRDNILAPGGHLALKLIKQPDREGLKFGDAPLMEFFASRGARFHEKKRYVIFAPLA